MSFETQIKEWVSIDNQLKIDNEKIKLLKDRKNDIKEEIIKYTIDNKLTSAVIELNDSKLKFVTTNTNQTLTLKYVENCLKKFINDDNDIKKIMDHIKTNRDIKSVLDIKRIYNK